MNDLRESLQRIRRLSAQFKQTRHWAALQDPLISEGTIRYERGGRLVWRTNAPAESEVILDDQRATIHYPSLGTTQTFDFSSEPGMGKLFQSIRSVLEADFDRLQPIFELRVERKVPLSVSLKPRAPEISRTVEQIRLEFDKELRLREVRLVETGSDLTEIVFHSHVIQTATQE